MTRSTPLHLLLTTTLALASASASAVAAADGFPYGNIALNNVEAFVYTSVRTLFVDKDPSIVDKSWSPSYIQHNPNIPNGPSGLKAFVTSADFSYDFGLIVSQQNIVAIHSLFTNNTSGAQNAVVDIFRVENGRIAEHWDVLQPVVNQTASGNPMVDPAKERNSYDPARCGDDAFAATARALAPRALVQIFGNASANVDDFLQDPYTQHNPLVPSGVAAIKGFLAQAPPAAGQPSPYSPGFVLAKCDVVLVHSRIAGGGAGAASSVVADIFRVANRAASNPSSAPPAVRLVEHWDVVQDETPASKTASGNPMIDPANDPAKIQNVDQAAYGPVGKYANQPASSSSTSTVTSSRAAGNGSVVVSAAMSNRNFGPFALVRSLFAWM
ncbi:hypothetical protein DFJ73DRAFT_862655 [Zopfochytrium polystomum]|nr:hypothetical protein DFJ73DRAFT_862655 [Zopfochytrium polystomum]